MFTEDDAKKKWKNLRDTFLKEIKKVKKSRSGDAQECAEIYTGKWIYYKSMLFLKDTMTPRDTEGYISEEDDMEQNWNEVEENNDENIEHIQSPVAHSFFVPESETDSYVTVPSVSTVLHSNISNDSDISAAQVISSKKRKKKQDNRNFEDELLKLESQKLSALLQSKEDKTSDDDDMLFLKSLHPYFNNLNNIQKLRIRNQIQSIFINELSAQGTTIVIICIINTNGTRTVYFFPC